MTPIPEIIAAYYEGTINLGDAEARLIDEVDKTELAEFIMDAFARGWITPFNLGIQ